jgi:predicted Mrr-cat superfamily restriction endonuclease
MHYDLFRTVTNRNEKKGLIRVQIFQMKSRPHDHDRTKQWIDEGFVNIGWPLIGDLTNVDKDELKDRLAADPYNYLGQVLANQLGTVSAFVHTMQANDIVLVMENEWVHIGQVGPYRYDPVYDNKIDGMCHQRSIKWLTLVQKEELNQEVQELLRNRGAVTRFKHPVSVANLDRFISKESKEIQEHNIHKLKLQAIQILTEAMQSVDHERRERAAAAILNMK